MRDVCCERHLVETGSYNVGDRQRRETVIAEEKTTMRTNITQPLDVRWVPLLCVRINPVLPSSASVTSQTRIETGLKCTLGSRTTENVMCGCTGQASAAIALKIE